MHAWPGAIVSLLKNTGTRLEVLNFAISPQLLLPLTHPGHHQPPAAIPISPLRWVPVFVTEWVRTWDTWSDLAQHWISTASAEDLDHISKLRVPQSLIDIVPRNRLHALRYRVAWHQYHMTRAVILLRRSLPMPPRVAENTKHTPSHSTPVWYHLCARRYTTGPLCQRKNPPGRERLARPPEERVDWLLLQPYSESNACALLRLISASNPPCRPRSSDTSQHPWRPPPTPPPPDPTREYTNRHLSHAVTVPS